MKNLTALKVLVPCIFVLALAAAAAGLFWPGGDAPYAITNFRGEPVTINARGLYYWDTLSSAVQMQGNDLVTLAVGLPMLAVSFWFTLRGSLRGRLALAGALGFFLYTYMSMCFGTAYNLFFPVYVALFSMSLFALLLTLMSFDLATLPGHFSERLPRRGIAILFFFSALFLLAAWGGRIAATYQGQAPALENVTSMFIQAMDLGLIVPLLVLAGVLVWKRTAWGYLLASFGLMKFITMGLAVSTMTVNMARAGVPVSPAEMAIFMLITLVNLGFAVALLRNLREAA